MAAEVMYQKTGAGKMAVKKIPAMKVLETAGEKSYFAEDNQLFMRLFRYIKANDVAMTVPVEVEVSPGVMRFHVGTRDAAKATKDSGQVKVIDVPERMVAALGLSGNYTDQAYRRGLDKLKKWLAENDEYQAAGEPYVTYWNSPFTPGMFKYSEVHIPVAARDNSEKDGKMKMRELTPEERHVIIGKGTEPPFSGKYDKHSAKGVYTCRQCGAALYRSADKFSSGCGWPSFDDEIDGAVRRKPDADGRRTEILCAQCGGHLGHVFIGEQFTDKNTRHCVNSISLDFVPAEENVETAQSTAAPALSRAIFAGGCFWGVEYYLEQVPGVKTVVSGYIGGHRENPTYREVCDHATGHAEAVEVTYDPANVTFEELARTFFEIHDPTQVDRQGPDVGEQYRSAVFYLDEEQKKTTEKLIGQLTRKGLKVATQVVPAGKFWPAEEYHQDYYVRKNGTPYCHRPVKRFD